MDDTIEEIYENAIVDAYTIDEQFWGFASILSDEISFPLEISVIGKNYTVTGIEAKCDRLKWIIDLNGEKFLIDITDTTMINGIQKNIKLVQAYLLWLSCE